MGQPTVTPQVDLTEEKLWNFDKELKEMIDKAFDKAMEAVRRSLKEFSKERQIIATKKLGAEVEARKVHNDSTRHSEFDKEEVNNVEAIWKLGYAVKVFDKSSERALEEERDKKEVNNVEAMCQLGYAVKVCDGSPERVFTSTGTQSEFSPHINSHFNGYAKFGKSIGWGGPGQMGIGFGVGYMPSGSGGGPGGSYGGHDGIGEEVKFVNVVENSVVASLDDENREDAESVVLKPLVTNPNEKVSEEFIDNRTHVEVTIDVNGENKDEDDSFTHLVAGDLDFGFCSDEEILKNQCFNSDSDCEGEEWVISDKNNIYHKVEAEKYPSLIQFSSWRGGDRDGIPRVTSEVRRDVCLLARMMAANMYFYKIEDLMFELFMWHCSDELGSLEEMLRQTKKENLSVMEHHEAKLLQISGQLESDSEEDLHMGTLESLQKCNFGFNCMDESIDARFPDFHLEDKVKLWARGNVMNSEGIRPLTTYMLGREERAGRSLHRIRVKQRIHSETEEQKGHLRRGV